MVLIIDIVDIITQIITQIFLVIWPITSKMLIFEPQLKIISYFFGSLFGIFLSLAAVISTIYLVMVLYVIFFVNGGKEKEKALDFKKAPFVSIHIPTRNELAAITCAKCCLEFDYPKDKMEILIGDDSDKPEISAKLKEFASKNSKLVKVIRREKNIGFKSGNLNNLIDYSKGDFFVIFDSDYAPPNDFLKRIIAPLVEDKNLSATQARWNPVNADQNFSSILAASIVYVFHLISLPFLKKLSGTVTLCGSAEAVRRSDLEALGKWELGSLTEDIEYSFRLIKANKKVLYLEGLECSCEVPFTTRDLYMQQMRWAYGVIKALKKHFFSILQSRNIAFPKKLPLFVAGIGYTFTTILFLLFMSGTITLISLPIYPNYETTRYLLMNTLLSILFTIGPVFASVLVLLIKKKVKYIARLLVSIFSIGIISMLYVNLGVIKALANKPMQWFLVSKNSNNLQEEV